jgi:hypothetical protein
MACMICLRAWSNSICSLKKASKVRAPGILSTVSSIQTLLVSLKFFFFLGGESACPLFIYLFLFIYSHVHTLFGSFLSPAPNPLPLRPTPLASRQNLFCHLLQFCWREDMSNNKTIFVSWDKDGYTKRFLALLPCTCVLQPKLVHLLTDLGHLPIVTSVILRLLY